MGCSINPFGKPTEDGPPRLGESAAQYFSHRKAMVRGGAGTYDSNSCSGIQMRKQRSIPLDVQPGRRGVQVIQTTGPGKVTRQKGTSRNIKVRLNPVLAPVTLNGSHTGRRPSKRLAKAIHRPTSDLIG